MNSLAAAEFVLFCACAIAAVQGAAAAEYAYGTRIVHTTTSTSRAAGNSHEYTTACNLCVNPAGEKVSSRILINDAMRPTDHVARRRNGNIIRTVLSTRALE